MSTSYPRPAYNAVSQHACAYVKLAIFLGHDLVSRTRLIRSLTHRIVYTSSLQMPYGNKQIKNDDFRIATLAKNNKSPFVFEKAFRFGSCEILQLEETFGDACEIFWMRFFFRRLSLIEHRYGHNGV